MRSACCSSRQRIDDATASLIERAIIAMRKDGTMDEILRRGVGRELAKSMRYEDRLCPACTEPSAFVEAVKQAKV